MEPIGYMDGVGALVRRRRKALRVDQQTVADLAGVSRKLVSDIERGKPTLRMDGLLAVLGAVGLTLEVVDAR
ncbi:MAG: helix-turn-helix domain-containing protein [Actinomycetota bacterium]|nr:helix-turn-helix domain-containing protein [Actinomycetota bacterium]